VKAGVKHVIITHPLLEMVGCADAQIKEAVGLGPEIYAEFTSQFGNPNATPETLREYVTAIRAAGVENSFVSSDTASSGRSSSPMHWQMQPRLSAPRGSLNARSTYCSRSIPRRFWGSRRLR
jgi:hypothetical protein